MKMLSCPSISTSLTEEAGVPSMFRLKTELLPPPKRIEDIWSLLALLLCTINRWVTDPTVVKTVSKKTVSVENVSFNEGFESILSFFLQEETVISARIISGIRLNLLILLNILGFFYCKCRKNAGLNPITEKGQIIVLLQFGNQQEWLTTISKQFEHELHQF